MSIRTTEIVKLPSRRVKNRFKYILENSDGKRVVSTNDKYIADSESKQHNLRLVENLGRIIIGKRMFLKQKIHREISTQIEMKI